MDTYWYFKVTLGSILSIQIDRILSLQMGAFSKSGDFEILVKVSDKIHTTGMSLG